MSRNETYSGIKHMITIYYQNRVVSTLDLSGYKKEIISLGRSNENDIVINSSIVSKHHAYFEIYGTKCTIKDDNSTNGIFINGTRQTIYELKNEDNIRIDNLNNPHFQGILLVYSRIGSDKNEKWSNFYIDNLDTIKIGRDPDNNINLNHNTISRHHAVIKRTNGIFSIKDLKSTNGTFVNGEYIKSKTILKENDVIFVGNTKMVFHKNSISYDIISSGLNIDAINISKTVTERCGFHSSKKKLLNDICLNIKSGELVALVGGSGAGKSTLMDALSGFRKATHGKVLVNDDDFYKNYNAYKNILGYVPQKDIVYDILSVEDMLSFSAKLRMPKDVTKEEINERVSRVIKDVELEGREKTIIKNLSGGQKKRVSIAVELLADPKLFFLDEPTSGLDPDMERSMMKLLKKLASMGKTVVLITHATANLKLCDKIVFLGKGGRMCYFGPPEGALDFFKVQDFVDIYSFISTEPVECERRFKESNYYIYHKYLKNKASEGKRLKKKGNSHSWNQFIVLTKRYFKLTLADRQRVIFLMVQSPLIAALLGIVTNKNSFDVFENAKQIIFTLSCSAVWIGMLNSIQEICKERAIFSRERMANLNLFSYIFSKFVVLGVICIIQAFSLIYVFNLFINVPSGYNLLGNLKLELVITIALTLFASTSMGLAISTLVSNTDRAMGLAPILLIPQIMFSGFIFKMQGFSEIISYAVISRWSAAALAVSLKINDLPLKIINDNKDNITIINTLNHITREIENIYNHDINKLLKNWIVLLVFTLLCIIISLILLKWNTEK